MGSGNQEHGSARQFTWQCRCGQRYRSTMDDIGKTARCRKCSANIVVPCPPSASATQSPPVQQPAQSPTPVVPPSLTDSAPVAPATPPADVGATPQWPRPRARLLIAIGAITTIAIVLGTVIFLALRARVEALEKALETQRQEVAQVRKDAAQGPAQAPQAGQVLPEVLAARSFVVVDENGNPRAMLFADKEGGKLGLADENGKNRAVLYADKEGGKLGLADENGNVLITLYADKEGGKLCLSDENGNLRAMLSADKNGGKLGLSDENGNPRVILYTDKEGGKLRLSDENGKVKSIAP